MVIGQKFYKIEVEALQLSLQQLKKKTLTKTFIKGTNKPQKGPLLRSDSRIFLKVSCSKELNDLIFMMLQTILLQKSTKNLTITTIK